jgi:S-layer homology domain
MHTLLKRVSSAAVAGALTFSTLGSALGQEMVILAQPQGPMTRIEFVAYVVSQTHTDAALEICLQKLSASDYTLLFNDVSREHPFARELCVAMREGIVRGYKDGTFRPDNIISFVEAAKVLVTAYDTFPGARFPVSEPWYKGYVQTMEYRGAILPSFTRLDAHVTGEQAQEMARRLGLGLMTDPSIGYEELWRRTVNN